MSENKTNRKQGVGPLFTGVSNLESKNLNMYYLQAQEFYADLGKFHPGNSSLALYKFWKTPSHTGLIICCQQPWL